MTEKPDVQQVESTDAPSQQPQGTLAPPESPQSRTVQSTYTQQPQGTPMMTIDGAATGEIGNRNSINKPLKPSGQRDWSFGIFDCFSARGTFFFACCFPCLVFSKNNFRLRHLNMLGDVHPASGNICSPECFAYGVPLCSSSPRFVHMALRRDIRHRYNIEGNEISDFLWVCCCGPCALTQESREIELEVQDSLTESLTAFFCSCRSTARPSLPNHPAVPTPRTLPNLPSLPSALSALGRRPPGPEQNPSSDSGKA